MNEKQRNQRERIKNRLQEIKTYAELCLEEFQDESTDTYYVDQKLGEISRIADISKILVRDYEDLMEEE
jgi:hypothetical protein